MRKTTANKYLSNTIILTGLACFAMTFIKGDHAAIYALMGATCLIYVQLHQRLVLKKA
ncbi:hypothetical protein OQX61_14855 [Pedobacter sp. PLR]|uniref:hypothetical protein n=1 Tax=Pedobacter sp. PLR TaxID=2994465 RepID=UPI002245F684|nr:hypothetical protein [Pedobacter sp. PLR]MCX2452554.1 hypothetical protein [Pedobacter sp. PLR]